MTDQLPFSWDYAYRYRNKARNQLPDFWRLKVIKKPLEILRKEVRPGDSILDIGAGNREIGEKISKALKTKNYKSMDVDRSQFHDYYSLNGIEECFEVVFLFEVIEHLSLPEGTELIKKAHSLLLPGGKLFLTTPNLYHPHRYWDGHHKTPYRYDDLGGILMATGFTLKNIYRIYNDAFLRRMFRIHCAAYLHRYLNIDFAPSILAVAQKKN